MKIRTFFSVLVCKMTKSALRFLGRGGTDFPGMVAMALYHNVLGELSKGVSCVIVTGTNGKTTSARMIEQVLIDAGVSYFTNKSGANLITGITAEFATNATVTGRPRKDYALIECDEAAFKEVSQLVDAKAVVVTNVFRDQLDRYGEVTHTLNNIKIGISHSPKATLCLNADDSLIASIADEVKQSGDLLWGGYSHLQEPGGRSVRCPVLHQVQARVHLRLRDLRPFGRLPLSGLRLSTGRRRIFL